MSRRWSNAGRSMRTWTLACGFLLIGAVAGEAGLMDTLSSGASYVAQGIKNKANAAATYITDSPAGKFVNASERNKRDRERILSVLSYEGAIYYDDQGKPQVKDQRKLDAYYQSLQSNNALDKVPGFRPADDPDGKQGGQFWRNFLDGKDHTRGDLPASMDPFENGSSGLATKMHSQLATPTDEASTGYADTAGTLKVRGIDILEKDLRQGVAAGADTYIKALDAITGGTSSQAVKWMEDAAKKAKDIADDPKAAVAGYVKDQVEGKIDDIKGEIKDKIGEAKGEMLAKADEALKNALGQDRYDDLMSKYEAYGEGQERIQKIFEDLAKVTGDERLADAAKKMKEFSPDAIADDLSKKYLPEILQGGDDEGEDDGEGEEDAAGDKEDQGDKTGADKGAVAGADDKAGQDATTEKGPETTATGPGQNDQTTDGDKTGVTGDEPSSGEPETVETPETTTEPEKTETAEPEKPEMGGDGETVDSENAGQAGAGDDGETDDDSGESDSETEADTGGENSSAEAPDSGETTTSSGYVEDSNGRTTLSETRGADGSLIRTTTTDTDKDGNVTGQTTYEGGTGEGQTTTPGGDLRGAEPGSDSDVSSDMVSGGYNTSEGFNAGWSQGQTERGEAGNMTMAQNTQMGDAANVGNQTIRDAGTVRDGGGRDAQTIGDNSARNSAKADQAGSWGKALGDAVEQGITEGGKAFGGALGGAAADEAVGAIFGTPQTNPEGEAQGSKGSSTAGTGATSSSAGGSSKGKDNPSKNKDDDGKDDEPEDGGSTSEGGCNEPCDNGTGGGETTTSAPSDDPLSVRGTTSNDDGTVTIRYGCGYSWTGKPPGPSRCPICSRETVSTENNPPADSGGTGGSGYEEPTDPTLTPPPSGYSGDTGSAPGSSITEPSDDDIDCPFAGPTENSD